MDCNFCSSQNLAFLHKIHSIARFSSKYSDHLFLRTTLSDCFFASVKSKWCFLKILRVGVEQFWHILEINLRQFITFCSQKCNAKFFINWSQKHTSRAQNISKRMFNKWWWMFSQLNMKTIFTLEKSFKKGVVLRNKLKTIRIFCRMIDN